MRMILNDVESILFKAGFETVRESGRGCWFPTIFDANSYARLEGARNKTPLANHPEQVALFNPANKAKRKARIPHAHCVLLL
jgi:hypothetical protein